VTLARISPHFAAAVVALHLVACGGTSTQRVADVTAAEGLYASRAEGARPLAPTFVAEAQLELEAARRAVTEGDEPTAAIHALRSVAAMQRAFVVARLARAKQEEATASADAGAADGALKALRAERARVDADVDDLEKKLFIAREAALPAESAGADAARAAARLRAASSLLAEARLLCGAAHLLDPSPLHPAAALTEAEARVAEAGSAIAKGPPPKTIKPPAPVSASAAPREPIDAAARARVACLAALTQARRTGSAAGQTAGTPDPDLLFSELSAAAAQRGAPGPVRDERGTMLTLRGAFQATELTEAGKQAVMAAALVARAHPGVALQVVVHEADPASAATSGKRLEAALRLLESSGVAKERIRGDAPGASLPVVAPTDAARRARNARLELVFVGR
jgi:outer membrane protein OmpA-like peptidoglycan-associated protein